MIDGAIKKLSEKCAQMIADNKLKFRELRQFNRVDGISGKKRDICQESPLQQVFEYIAVYALQPLFDAKILYCQFGSIPGKGQVKGAQRISYILHSPKFKDKRVDCIKCDVRKAYPSTKVSTVHNLIAKYCGKNKQLISLVDAIMANYPNHHLIIGGYFSTWAFNLVMSEVLREFNKLYKERRGQRIKLVEKIVCYADDFLLFGYKSNLKRAIKTVAKRIKAQFGLEIKNVWTIIQFPSKEVENHPRYKNTFIDMMGFRIYRHHRGIRKKIFRRARRQFIRANRLSYVPIWRARKVAAYNSWLTYSKSRGVILNYHINTLMNRSKQSISNHSREELTSYERDLLLYPESCFDFSRWRKNRRYFEEKYRKSHQTG